MQHCLLHCNVHPPQFTALPRIQCIPIFHCKRSASPDAVVRRDRPLLRVLRSLRDHASCLGSLGPRPTRVRASLCALVPNCAIPCDFQSRSRAARITIAPTSDDVTSVASVTLTRLIHFLHTHANVGTAIVLCIAPPHGTIACTLHFHYSCTLQIR